MILALAIGLLVQDGTADLLRRLPPVVDRAGDLDPELRADAAREAGRIWDEQGPLLAALAKGRNLPAIVVMALAGKSDAAPLLAMADRSARLVACDRVTPSKEQLPDVLKLLDSKDAGLRLAACRALGRVEDPALRQAISSALGHGMRRTGSAHVLFAFVSSIWRGSLSPQLFLLNDGDPERAGLAIAALCNLPELVVTEAFSASLLRVLENEKVDRTLRSLLLRTIGRRSPWALCPLLSIRDGKFRSEIVEILDRTPADALLGPPLRDAWREARKKSLDDAAVRIEGWLKRHCGDDVTPENFPQWMRKHFRAHVDRRADAAARRGAEGLLRLCGNTTSWKGLPGGLVGLSAFTAYALLKCDVAPDDPGLARCLDALVDRDPEGIYATSLAAMALAAAVEKGAPRRERLERRLQSIAEILVASQLKSGGWSYVARGPADPATSGWSDDLSNTQFAILGLRAAANAGAKVPRATWERARTLLEKAQKEDGGWGYQGTDDPSTSRMTAAGAGSWILCSLSLDETFAAHAAAESPRVRDALRWLMHATDPSRMPGPPDYYLLYSLERICMVSRIETLGDRDWYAEGASILLRSQGRDGLWKGAHGPVPDTCMALLFLRKAFIARPEIATEPARRRASPEQALAVYERYGESMFVEGVCEIRPDRDPETSFILVVAESEAAAKRLRETLGQGIEGVPLRISVKAP